MKLLNRLKFNRTPVFFWAYAAVILAVVTPWFLKPGYLFFTDNVWGPVINLDWANSGFILNLLVKVLSSVFPIDFLGKLFISGILILILLGGRLLVKIILEYYRLEGNGMSISRGLIFSLSLFALFNPFVYDRALYGQFGILAAYACFLFVLAYLLKIGRTLDFKLLYRVAVFSGLTLLFSLHFIFLLAPFYLLFLIGLFLKRKEIRAGGAAKKMWLTLFFSLLIVLVINANWLIALTLKSSSMIDFVEKGISARDLAAFQTAGKTPLETFTNVLLMSGFWGKNQYRYFDLTTAPGWERSFIFLAPLIIYGIYLSFRHKSRKEKILSAGLLIIFSLAVYLAIGIKSPLTRGFSLFLYDYLPLYKGLREPQKWVAVIIPIYLYYLTWGAVHLSKAKLVINNKILSGIILAAVIVMQAPSLLWGFNRQVISTPYPGDWYEANRLLVSKSEQSNNCHDIILFLPWHMYLSFNWVGRIIANPASTFFTCPVLSGTNMEWGGIYDNSESPSGKAVASWLATKGSGGTPLLSGFPIRYIILAKELDFPSYLWLNGLSYVHPLLETKTLLIYEVKY